METSRGFEGPLPVIGDDVFDGLPLGFDEFVVIVFQLGDCSHGRSLRRIGRCGCCEKQVDE